MSLRRQLVYHAHTPDDSGKSEVAKTPYALQKNSPLILQAQMITKHFSRTVIIYNQKHIVVSVTQHTVLASALCFEIRTPSQHFDRNITECITLDFRVSNPAKFKLIEY